MTEGNTVSLLIHNSETWSCTGLGFSLSCQVLVPFCKTTCLLWLNWISPFVITIILKCYDCGYSYGVLAAQLVSDITCFCLWSMKCQGHECTEYGVRRYHCTLGCVMSLQDSILRGCLLWDKCEGICLSPGWVQYCLLLDTVCIRYTELARYDNICWMLGVCDIVTDAWHTQLMHYMDTMYLKPHVFLTLHVNFYYEIIVSSSLQMLCPQVVVMGWWTTSWHTAIHLNISWIGEDGPFSRQLSSVQIELC